MSKVAIIDGGGANIASLEFALQRLGATSELTADPHLIRKAERVILPGVGAAADAMTKLRQSGVADLIPQLTQPLLGICLGMQLLFEGSDEDETACLGVLAGRARRFKATPGLPVPHMGWNRISKRREAALLDGIPEGAYFYFVHSFAVDVTDDTIATSDYGRPFTAIVQKANFMGTQFHPERSGEHGARLLQNFLRFEGGKF